MSSDVQYAVNFMTNLEDFYEGAPPRYETLTILDTKEEADAFADALQADTPVKLNSRLRIEERPVVTTTDPSDYILEVITSFVMEFSSRESLLSRTETDYVMSRVSESAIVQTLLGTDKPLFTVYDPELKSERIILGVDALISWWKPYQEQSLRASNFADLWVSIHTLRDAGDAPSVRDAIISRLSS